jgi:serine/threonine-protein kinase RsbW
MNGNSGLRPQALELRLPVAVESVEHLRQAVWHWLGDTVLPPRVATTMELVVEEVVMNLVMHAFDDPQGHSFGLRVERVDDELRFAFDDDGRDFDPAAPGPGRDALSPGETRPGGLGLPLLRKRTRWMRHARRDGRNMLSIGIALNEGS